MVELVLLFSLGIVDCLFESAFSCVYPMKRVLKIFIEPIWKLYILHWKFVLYLYILGNLILNFTINSKSSNEGLFNCSSTSNKQYRSINSSKILIYSNLTVDHRKMQESNIFYVIYPGLSLFTIESRWQSNASADVSLKAYLLKTIRKYYGQLGDTFFRITAKLTHHYWNKISLLFCEKIVTKNLSPQILI